MPIALRRPPRKFPWRFCLQGYHVYPSYVEDEDMTFIFLSSVILYIYTMTTITGKLNANQAVYLQQRNLYQIFRQR